MALYSDKVMDHFQNPRNVGKMDDADGVGEVGNAKCGDIMKMYIKVKDGIITDVKFNTFGCGSAIATSSMATELIKGKKVEDALELSNKAVVEALDGLPAHKIHCPSLQRKLLQRQSRITMTATALRTIPSCSARSCTIVKAAQNNQNVEKAPHTGSFFACKVLLSGLGQAMHAQSVEHSEALGVQAQPARAEVKRAQLEVQRNRFCPRCCHRETGSCGS